MVLLTDVDGGVWAGTMTGGLNRIDIDTGVVTTFRADPDSDNSLPANGIMALLEARNGDLWIGTFGGGLNRYRDGDLTSLGPTNRVTGQYGAGPGFRFEYDSNEVYYDSSSYGICFGSGTLATTLDPNNRL